MSIGKTLHFGVQFKTQDLGAEYTEEQWEILALEIFNALEGIEISVKVPNKELDWEEQTITIEPVYTPEIVEPYGE